MLRFMRSLLTSTTARLGASIVAALGETQGNLSGAARRLGIGRTTIYRKIRELAITVPMGTGFRGR